MKRIIAASLLFTLGTILYLSLSRGSTRVQILTVLVQMAYLFLLSYIAWVAPLPLRGRWLALLVTALGMSAAAVYLDSFLVMALRPLHPLYFIRGFAGFLVEGALFLGLTWFFDRAIDAVKAKV